MSANKVVVFKCLDKQREEMAQEFVKRFFPKFKEPYNNLELGKILKKAVNIVEEMT